MDKGAGIEDKDQETLIRLTLDSIGIAIVVNGNEAIVLIVIHQLGKIF